MFPWYALLVLGLALGVSAVAWLLGARLRARRGEQPLPDFRSMMGRGLVVPTAMIFMAADFASGPTVWTTWIALAFGSWIVTLAVVRVVIRAIGFSASTAKPAKAAAPQKGPAEIKELQVEATG